MGDERALRAARNHNHAQTVYEEETQTRHFIENAEHDDTVLYGTIAVATCLKASVFEFIQR